MTPPGRSPGNFSGHNGPQGDPSQTDPRVAVASAMALPRQGFVMADHATAFFITALILSVVLHAALVLKYANTTLISLIFQRLAKNAK